MGWKFWKWFRPIQSVESNHERIVKEVKRKFVKFPCADDNCLVRAGCTKPCEKIEMDNNKLKSLFEKYEACPDCGSEGFYGGPSGGASQNVKCQGCGHYFNWALPVMIERIHVDENGFREAW